MKAFYLYDPIRKGYVTGFSENSGGIGPAWPCLKTNMLLAKGWATEANAQRWADQKRAGKPKGGYEIHELTVEK